MSLTLWNARTKGTGLGLLAGIVLALFAFLLPHHASAQAITVAEAPSQKSFRQAGETITHTFTISNPNAAAGGQFTVTGTKIGSGCSLPNIPAFSTQTCTSTYTTTAADLGSDIAYNYTYSIGCCFTQGPVSPSPISFIRANASVALSSSTGTLLTGSSLTLTATVSPSTATGAVTFLDGATPLCANVAVTGGVATCTVTLLAAGTHTITAAYGGSALFASATSPAVLVVSTDQRQKTAEAIGRFLGARNNQILTNDPDGHRQIDRLIEMGSADAGGNGAGFTGGGAGSDSTASGTAATTSRLGDRLGVADGSRLRGFTGSSRPIGDAIAANAVGAGSGLGANGTGDCGSPTPAEMAAHPTSAASLGAGETCDQGVGGGGGLAANGVRLQGNFEGAMRLGFSWSARDAARAAVEAEERRLRDAGLGLSSGSGVRNRGAVNPFDVWVEGRYTSFHDRRSADDLDGHIGLVTIGADYVLNRSLLIGTFVQLDQQQQRSDVQATEVKGQGWMAGPYATVRLSDNVFWQGRAAGGQSSNKVSPFLTYVDKFDSTRWLLASTLTGRWTHGAWTFRPSASIAYIEDTSSSYTDSQGALISSVNSRLGQAKAGPEASYRFALGDGTTIEPRAGLQAIWTFTQDTTAASLTSLSGDPAGPSGVRGRAELGLRVTTVDGVDLDLSGTYDGIGAVDYGAVSGRAIVRVPF